MSERRLTEKGLEHQVELKYKTLNHNIAAMKKRIQEFSELMKKNPDEFATSKELLPTKMKYRSALEQTQLVCSVAQELINLNPVETYIHSIM